MSEVGSRKKPFAVVNRGYEGLFREALKGVEREVSDKERAELLALAEELDGIAGADPGRARRLYRFWLDTGLAAIAESAPSRIAAGALAILRAEIERRRRALEGALQVRPATLPGDQASTNTHPPPPWWPRSWLQELGVGSDTERGADGGREDVGNDDERGGDRDHELGV